MQTDNLNTLIAGWSTEDKAKAIKLCTETPIGLSRSELHIAFSQSGLTYARAQNAFMMHLTDLKNIAMREIYN